MTPYDATNDPIDRIRFPRDPWRLVETSPGLDDLGLSETLFAVANGYIGMRGNPEEGRPSHAHGTFLNGLHETWEIKHAEAAFGFARTGQTIINAPDAKMMKIYVDDEPLALGTATIEEYERSLDFRDGILRRHLLWRTPSGKRVRIDTTRMISMEHRHLALLTLELTLLDSSAPVVISSQLINRQDVRDEYQRYVTPHSGGVTIKDPRKSGAFSERVLLPQMNYANDQRLGLGFKCANSGMTVAVSVDHRLSTSDPVETITRTSDDAAKTVFRIDASAGSTIRLVKTVAYHSSRGVPVIELSDRCDRTLDRAVRTSVDDLHTEQARWFDRFWSASDVEIDAPVDSTVLPSAENVALQQATRFNLFNLAQASARADGIGIPAKGLTGSGYEGHYFWDTEVYVVPFLAYTSPSRARNVLHFRSVMLPAARDRAREMAQKGALFPWRTINGEEASAYYAAGTAQVHIDADISYAVMKYVRGSGDRSFLTREGIDILVETARMWADLGFWRTGTSGEAEFNIHGVTGPDEYTTVNNNNLYTNVMARDNLENAVSSLEEIRAWSEEEFAAIVSRLQVSDSEIAEWRRCAHGMRIPFDETLGIHPQDDAFLQREVWDLPSTPESSRPLLLHYHPLVIYRFQVLKQADVVMALFLKGDRFSAEQKKADYDYYDPITTGDSTLSAVVQSIMAAEVGYHAKALEYFRDALFVDLGNLHDNTIDGLHIASAGGVWGTLVFGFGGMRDHEGRLTFDPRLPESWPSLTFRLKWHGSRIVVRVSQVDISFTLDHQEEEAVGNLVPVEVRGEVFDVKPDSPVVVPLEHHGPRRRSNPEGETVGVGVVPDPIPESAVPVPDQLV